MRFLLSNDDGIMAPGLIAMAKELVKIGEVFIVAPDGERSAKSHSITVHDPLRLDVVPMEGIEAWKCSGSPVDCVKLGIEGLRIDPDIVIAGINAGYNLGMDVLYSGTVGAAAEGAIHHIPSFAVSYAGRNAADFPAVAKEALRMIEQFKDRAIAEKLFLNINFPQLSESGKYEGMRVTPLGQRDYANTFLRRKDPNGRTYYWMGGTPIEETRDIDTDTVWIQKGYITVTPLQLDFTAHTVLDRLRD